MQEGFIADNQLGYQQITSLNTAKTLTVPTGCSKVIMTPEGQAVRWRADGVAPTASVGYPLAVGSELTLTASQLAQFQAIEQVASATLNVYYFG